MKVIALSAVASVALAGISFAGQPVVEKNYKPVVPTTCFDDRELQVDLFGSFTSSGGVNGEGFGGGLGVNYFFVRNFGIGVDGDLRGADGSAVWETTGRLIARWPIDSACIAPYVFAGGGLIADGTTVGSWHAGGGLEWRASQKVGIFGEGRYTWGANDNDAAQARVGVRFLF